MATLLPVLRHLVLTVVHSAFIRHDYHIHLYCNYMHTKPVSQVTLQLLKALHSQQCGTG